MSCWRAGLLCMAAMVVWSCAQGSRPKPDASQQPVVSMGLVLLTREGCVNTDTMRAHLDEALRTLHRPLDYQFIDQSTLGRNDPRQGYPTPTLLLNNRDMFGLPVPTAPYPEPT